MVRTRMLSILAASWMLALAGWEVVGVSREIAGSESVDWNVAPRVVIFLVVVLAAFIARLIALANVRATRYSPVAFSWLFCAIVVLIHFTDTYPAHTAFRLDSLATWSLVYVLLTCVRFVLTATFAAGTRSHESNSYS